ncbi:MAG: hypothetical protein GY799_05550 [Desulfobulbaceae bacterium]|nr:hypothetical protein [Desulfobulbaceae bacterium]
MITKNTIINVLFNSLPPHTRERILYAKDLIVQSKEKGGKIAVAVGSGPNIHEGVTTLIAELMHKGIVDCATTSSAVISHELAGTLDIVKRIDTDMLGLDPARQNYFKVFEATMLSPEQHETLRKETFFDPDFYDKLMRSPGNSVIKAAGNMAYPMGLKTEFLATEILELCRLTGRSFEEIAGLGADPMTMVGAGAQTGLPVLVTIPQLVGGGKVGFAVGDSISISERSLKVAQLFDSADIIIESAIALSQEIHDGPLETFTGHGVWSDWQDEWTYSLRDKKIIRMDLDPNLEAIWQKERATGEISNTVIKGLPKTKVTGLPFRMEMSGFSRLPGSLPIIGDIGNIWPILMTMVAETLAIELDFMSYNQSSPEGLTMRQWIVDTVQPVNMAKIKQTLKPKD